MEFFILKKMQKPRDAVENIVWTDRSKLAPGRYTV